eukprot:192636-Prymnesium_polylepis.2
MFFRYDTDCSGTIDKAELRSMMYDLDRTYINTSRALVDKFVEYEVRGARTWDGRARGCI